MKNKTTRIAVSFLLLALVAFALVKLKTSEPPLPPGFPTMAPAEVAKLAALRAKVASSAELAGGATSYAVTSVKSYIAPTLRSLSADEPPIISFYTNSDTLIGNMPTNEMCYLEYCTNLLGNWAILTPMTNGSVYQIIGSANYYISNGLAYAYLVTNQQSYYRLVVIQSQFVVTFLPAPTGERPKYLYNFPLWEPWTATWQGCTNPAATVGGYDSFEMFSNDICEVSYPQSVTNIYTNWPVARVVEWQSGVALSTNYATMYPYQDYAEFEIDVVAKATALRFPEMVCSNPNLSAMYNACCGSGTYGLSLDTTLPGVPPGSTSQNTSSSSPPAPVVSVPPAGANPPGSSPQVPPLDVPNPASCAGPPFQNMPNPITGGPGYP